MLESIANLLLTDTFWVAVGTIGAVIALFLTYTQIRASRIIAAADFLLRLEKNFNSVDMIAKRKKILKIWQKNLDDYEKMDCYRSVFDFFEELGLLLRKKIIPKELVWSDYCHWILYYYTAFSGYIEWVRKAYADVTIYCEFEYLFKEMQKYEKKKLKQEVAISSKQMAKFIEEEISFLST